MTGRVCCAVRRRRRTADRQHRARRGLSRVQDRRVSEPVKPCELRVSVALSQLVSGDMYLWVCLDDCLPSCCVWLFGVGPEEIVLLVGGSCLGASSSALWLCDRRGRYSRRHGGQCRWVCGRGAIEVEQQLQAVVWCSGRRDDGKCPSRWNVLNRHTWPKPPSTVQSLDPASSPAPQSAAVRHAPTADTFRIRDHGVWREGSEFSSVADWRRVDQNWPDARNCRDTEES
jgi:hypothetical protein